MAGNIFISYRRADTEGFAHAIYNLLAPEFGAEHIFMDVDAITPGQDFVAVLEQAVNRSDVLLALIGPKWLDIAGPDGGRRLDNPGDFVRIEIASALARGITVIPVLVGGAAMPAEASLPDDLKPLSRRQAFTIGQHLNPDVQRLIGVMRAGQDAAAPARRTDARPAKRLKYGNWFLLFLVTTVIVFVGVRILLGNILANITTPEMASIMEITIMTTLVGLLQWLILLAGRYENAWLWPLANLAFGILIGILISVLLKDLFDVLLTGLFFVMWMIFNGMLGPIIIRAVAGTQADRN